MLRPVLPGLADEMIAAIAVEVPDYQRAMEGTFGQLVRMGVEVALNRFMDMVADPGADVTRARDTYVNLGRGEFHSGRSLDALMAAYRVGARLAWRRFVEAGTAAELPPEALYSLGEAMFAYIDEISAESADGYAEEQSAAAGESQRRRRRLVRLLAQEPPAAQEAIRTAAQAAAWALPRGVAALVAAAADTAAGAEAGGAPPGRRRARARRGDRRGDRRAAGAPARRRCDRRRRRRFRVRVHPRPRRPRPPPPDRRGGRRRRVGRDRARARDEGGSSRRGEDRASGREDGERARREAAAATATAARSRSRSGRPSRGTTRRRAFGARPPHSGWRPTGGVAGEPLVVAEDHLATLLLASDRGLAADLAATRLAPLDGLAGRPPRAPDRDAAGVARPARAGAGGRRRARRPPPDRALPAAPAARAVRHAAGGPRGAVRALSGPSGGLNPRQACAIHVCHAPPRDGGCGHAGPRCRDGRRGRRPPGRRACPGRPRHHRRRRRPRRDPGRPPRGGHQLRRLDRRRRRRGT